MMTLRVKVVLFAVMAVGLIGVMGGALLLSSVKGSRSRELAIAIEEQKETYIQLRSDAMGYLGELLRARAMGGDTGAPRAVREAGAEESFARLRSLLEAMEQHGGGRGEAERRQVENLHHAYRRWLGQAEASVKARSSRGEEGLLMEMSDGFEREVGSLLDAALEEERGEQQALRQESAHLLRLGQMVGGTVPLLSLLLVIVLGLAITLPVYQSLREMLEGAERIGRGEFDVKFALVGHAECITLACAFNRMADELRDTLREKQRLAKAEAEASEREMRRYNALLEETVRQRTLELEQANARLTDSLRELQTTQSQLLFADRLATVGQLAAGVGHEINNPLAFILSNIHFARQELERMWGAPAEVERQEVMEALTEAREGAERVRLIVQDLKMLSRPDDMRRGPVQVDAVVRSAAKMAGHVIRSRAQLILEVEDVPMVHGNGARLCQVFLNLLINAAHAIAPGEEAKNRIQVSARESGPGLVSVEVSDTGCGIPAENLKRIFDPFFTTKSSSEGTGLGLSVCHGIIAAHGGHITVRSEPGRGTTFSIHLPVHGARKAAAPGEGPHVEEAPPSTEMARV
ncbi:sensor histidine kinase [Archangium sp.]|uniref:sensor histidine kinase n=1 Tax=Archangium sp. TaxID=1872627 RepID=UPI002D248C54|nr:ATP-binding protein [Archangium sp.]HYO58172.1 ATP-binding protein [Archangium sp.]